MGIFLVSVSEGVELDGKIEAIQTEEYIVCCSHQCGFQWMIDNGYPVSAADGLAGGPVAGEPILYTDGRETGRMQVVEYGYSPSYESVVDEFCPCGIQTTEGTEDE